MGLVKGKALVTQVKEDFMTVLRLACGHHCMDSNYSSLLLEMAMAPGAMKKVQKKANWEIRLVGL